MQSKNEIKYTFNIRVMVFCHQIRFTMERDCVFLLKIAQMDTGKLRAVAGKFATGITVITHEDASGNLHGMTANSFVSVSLDPPLVSFAVQCENTLAKRLSKSEIVGISILDASMQAISNHFAGQPQDGIPLAWAEKKGAKVLLDGMGWYATRVNQILPAGDHLLYLCEVLDLDCDESKSPLLYFKGYKTLAS